VKHPGLLAMAVVGWSITLICCGSALAMLARSHAELSAAIDIGSLFFTCLAGALVPLQTMPAWARELAPVSPGYWAMRALRGALLGDTAATLSSLALLAAVALAAAAFAGVKLARGWGRTGLL
jgi:ABC-2 type transport system permease protein